MIKIYTLNGCHNCELAKELISKHGIIFDEVNCQEAIDEIPRYLKLGDIDLPILKVQDNFFSIGPKMDYLKSIIDKILKI
jgi:glutaredoxin